ncbi:MAG: hypothetical protein KAU14_06750 [Thermoplasmata archaeon]|nr:hypothetical protein [Thermoplasmata archaeon]
MLQYHHCRSLESIIFGEVKSPPAYSGPDFKDAYLWLKKEVGFYPTFLAVGTTEEDIRMTGYQDNWRVKISDKKCRKRGEFPNMVLFSFEDVDGIFTDYDYWHLVLNASYKDYQMTDYEKRLIFKPSWQKSKWLRKANKNPHSVQLITKTLYLPGAERIWVRNRQTKKLLEFRGFRNVEVKRIRLE